MRYEELTGPLTGWTYDQHGTIFTPSGYRCTAQQIEGMLWLFGCLPFRPEKYLIHSDEATGAMRPLYELADIDPSGNTNPTRIQAKPGSAGRCSTVGAATKKTRQPGKTSIEN